MAVKIDSLEPNINEAETTGRKKKIVEILSTPPAKRIIMVKNINSTIICV